MSIGEQLRNKAIEILKNYPKGIRYGDLLKEVQNAYPGTKWNTLQGALWNLDAISKGTVFKPQRGMMILSEYLVRQEDDSQYVKQSSLVYATNSEQERNESRFYEPFADYLQNDLSECNKAKSFGGNRLGRKWMTPDVVGYYRVKTTASFPRAPEIITAEIKVTKDYQNAISGFGQASSYLLYSHKSYLVLPMQMNYEDMGIIETLCTTFGIGLVVFDADSPEEPSFSLKNKAQRREPDIFYLNEYGTKIVDYLEED